MKRAVPHRRGSFLFAGAMLVLAGIAWGAAVRTHAAVPHVAATASHARVAYVAPAAINAASVMASHVASPAANPRLASAPASGLGEAGMRIFKDPETGEIGPPTAENAAVIASDQEPQLDVATLRQIPLPHGGFKLDLQGRVEDAMVVQLDPQGHKVFTCTKDPQAALRQPVQAPTSMREDR
jgi:hypothetical protein